MKIHSEANTNSTFAKFCILENFPLYSINISHGYPAREHFCAVWDPIQKSSLSPEHQDILLDQICVTFSSTYVSRSCNTLINTVDTALAWTRIHCSAGQWL